MRLLRKALTGCWNKLKQLNRSSEAPFTFQLTKEDIDILVDRAAKDAAIACINIVRQAKSPPIIRPLNLGLASKIIRGIKEKFQLS